MIDFKIRIVRNVEVISVIHMGVLKERKGIVLADDMARFKDVGGQAGKFVAPVGRVISASISGARRAQGKTNLLGSLIDLEDDDVFVAGRYA